MLRLMKFCLANKKCFLVCSIKYVLIECVGLVTEHSIFGDMQYIFLTCSEVDVMSKNID